jgi:single-strand DNA-binding protein
MSWDINHVVIVGRLTKDPELTYTQSGAAVCRFGIAVNRSTGSRSGGSRSGDDDQSASFFNFVAWNKTAEICKEYLSKGRQVGVDGRLQQRRWEGQDGVRRNTVEIVANNVQFFGGPRDRSDRFSGDSKSGDFRTGDSGSEESSYSGDYGEGYQEPGSPAGPLPNRVRSEKEGESDKDPFLSELDDDEIPF